MNIALIAHSEIFTKLQGLFRWIGSAKTPLKQAESGLQSTKVVVAPKFIATHAHFASSDSQNLLQKPLRVVRVLEAGQAQSSVGRMVISGRMADVCAELDRLAACEAALL